MAYNSDLSDFVFKAFIVFFALLLVVLSSALACLIWVAVWREVVRG